MIKSGWKDLKALPLVVSFTVPEGDTQATERESNHQS